MSHTIVKNEEGTTCDRQQWNEERESYSREVNFRMKKLKRKAKGKREAQESGEHVD